MVVDGCQCFFDGLSMVVNGLLMVVDGLLMVVDENHLLLVRNIPGIVFAQYLFFLLIFLTCL